MKTKSKISTRHASAYIAVVEWVRFVSGMGGGGGFRRPAVSKRVPPRSEAD